MTAPNPRPHPLNEQFEGDINGPQPAPERPYSGRPATEPADDPATPAHFAADAPPLYDTSHPADEHPHDSYDPVWTGQGELSGPSEAVTQADLDRIEQILSSEHFRVRRKRQQEFVPPPPPPAAKKTHGLVWAAGTFALLVTASAFIAYQTTARVPLLDGAADAGGAMSRAASLIGGETPRQAAVPAAPAPAAAIPAAAPAAAPAPAAPTKAHLVVNGANADSPDRILVGVAAEGSTPAMSAVISGLEPGTTLSAGRPWGATGWVVPAPELATTYLHPPAGFSGTMEYSVVLQRADNSVLDRQTMRLEWAAANMRPPAQPDDTARDLPPEEIGALLKRGEELLMQGDVASARLLLQRAADAQDARAAFTLAASYDPIELKRLGVYGAVPDVTKARDWYERAKQYGSREAPRRLELLASQFR